MFLFQVKLVNIRNDDITDGNPKLTLGLIWTIILHFQVGHGNFLLKGHGAGGGITLSPQGAGICLCVRVFRGDAGTTRIGPEDQHPWQCHGDGWRGIATPFSRHLHNAIINDGLRVVASRLAPGLLAVAVCSAESLKEKSKFGGGRSGDRLSRAVIPRCSRPFGRLAQPRDPSLEWKMSAA